MQSILHDCLGQMFACTDPECMIKSKQIVALPSNSYEFLDHIRHLLVCGGDGKQDVHSSDVFVLY